MRTRVKSEKEIIAMRHGGALLAGVHQALRQTLTPGMTTKDLAEIARKELKGTGGKPSFLGQYGFPDVICISVNDEVVHGIPSEQRVIQEGDLVSMDYGVTYEGMITDSSITVIAGRPRKSEHQKLVTITEESLRAGINVLHDGVRVGDIAAAIQAVLDKYGYGIVRDLVGHGVGHQLHEDPNIPNYGAKGTGPRLSAGMTIAIEPMATLGSHRVYIDKDQWTVRTVDGSLSAHSEHTILITEDGAEVLTSL